MATNIGLHGLSQGLSDVSTMVEYLLKMKMQVSLYLPSKKSKTSNLAGSIFNVSPIIQETCFFGGQQHGMRLHF